MNSRMTKNKMIRNNMIENKMIENKMIKKRLLHSTLAGLLAFSSISAVLPVPQILAQTQADIIVNINGSKVDMDPAPQIVGSRTLVPIRMIMEQLGAQVDWDEVQRTVRVTTGNGKALTLWVDNRLVCYEENGIRTYDVCDVSPTILREQGDRTFVPLRLVGNALGITVDWDAAKRSVEVNSNQPAAKAKFYNLSFNQLSEHQIINGQTALSLNLNGQQFSGATQIKYLLLDPVTGKGKMIARSTNLPGAATWLPDPSAQGSRVLAAALCDAKGNFIAGAALPVQIAVSPQIQLSGVADQQTITGAVQLSNVLNFAAESVIYDFKSLATGVSTQSQAVDPVAAYTFNPTTAYNGTMEIRVIALDKAGQQHTSAPVTVNVAVPVAPAAVTLKSFSAGNLGKIPVTLSISRNFDVTLTQYWARNTATNQEVLLAEKPYGDYSWFPGPEMAGTWEVYVKVTTPAGKVYTSNSYTVKVPAVASIILSGVGPDEVITGPVNIKSVSNVALQQVSYILKNPNNGSQKVLGTVTDPGQTVTWTPEAVNEGKRTIQAVATTAAGETITSEVITVKVYLGTTFSAQPIVAKDQFISYVTPMALATQKENGMSAALQVAQAILETGWGQSVPVDKYTGLLSYNLFGIKGSATAGSVISNTWEEYYGTKYRIDAQFRAYRNAQESWNDHNSLLLTKERYVPYTNVMFNSTWGAYALQRCGYATDSQYPAKLIKIIKDYNLDQLDLQKL